MPVYRIPPKKRNFLLNMSLSNQLIFINIITFFIGIVLFKVYGENFVLNNIALNPSMILSGKSLWTLITCMFMHGSFFHLFANMFSLFFIGNFLERIIGRKRFFGVYIISGIIGGAFFVLASLIMGDVNTSAVGASGAIFGLLGVLVLLVPYSKVYFIAGPLILILLDVVVSPFIPLNVVGAWDFVVNILIFVMILSLFSFNSKLRRFSIPIELPMWLVPIIAIVPLSIISFFVELPIGNSAHFGGLVAGLIYAFYLINKFPNKTKRLRVHFR